jgi:sugar phosphate isomerase/epimerase
MYASFYARGLGLDLDPAGSVDLAARAGFHGVDLLARELPTAPADLAALRRRMLDQGLRPGAIPLPIDWRHNDDARFAADLAQLPRLLDSVRTLGYTRTATWILPGLGNAPLSGLDPDAPDDDVLLDAHARRLVPVVERLARAGIRLGLEVIGVPSFRKGPAWVHTLSDERVDRLLARLRDTTPPGPSPGVLVDAYHLHAANEPTDAALARGARAVVWVHVADLPADFRGSRGDILDHDRDLPGASGLVPVADLLARLHAAGYDGPVSPEPLGGSRTLRGLPTLEVALRARESLRNLWPAP